MNAYLDLMIGHQLAIARLFFALMVGVDLLSLYAYAFDRGLPGRLVGRWVAAVSGRQVTVAPSVEPVRLWQHLVFWSLSAIPPALWAAFEFVRAHGSP